MKIPHLNLLLYKNTPGYVLERFLDISHNSSSDPPSMAPWALPHLSFINVGGATGVLS